MYILQHSPPPRQCTDSLSFPIIFELIRQFVGYKKPRGAGCSSGDMKGALYLTNRSKNTILQTEKVLAAWSASFG